MKIRKEFSVESAHIVRNCTSHRCSHSIHGHSAVIEVFLESTYLDNAQMVYDFGLMKGTVKQFIDSMDHCYLLCKHDDDEFKKFIKGSCDRWIELPFNPSAEMLSLWILKEIKNIFEHTEVANGECAPKVTGVRYHETTTGWAEANLDDLYNLWMDEYDDIIFSTGVTADWSDDLAAIRFLDSTVFNKPIPQQIHLPQLPKYKYSREGVGEEVYDGPENGNLKRNNEQQIDVEQASKLIVDTLTNTLTNILSTLLNIKK